MYIAPPQAFAVRSAETQCVSSWGRSQGSAKRAQPQVLSLPSHLLGSLVSPFRSDLIATDVSRPLVTCHIPHMISQTESLSAMLPCVSFSIPPQKAFFANIAQWVLLVIAQREQDITVVAARAVTEFELRKLRLLIVVHGRAFATAFVTHKAATMSSAALV